MYKQQGLGHFSRAANDRAQRHRLVPVAGGGEELLAHDIQQRAAIAQLHDLLRVGRQSRLYGTDSSSQEIRMMLLITALFYHPVVRSLAVHRRAPFTARSLCQDMQITPAHHECDVGAPVYGADVEDVLDAPHRH